MRNSCYPWSQLGICFQLNPEIKKHGFYRNGDKVPNLQQFSVIITQSILPLIFNLQKDYNTHTRIPEEAPGISRFLKKLQQSK